VAAATVRRTAPVRAYFNDPRISGDSKAFHFGIDISAPNGTPAPGTQQNHAGAPGRYRFYLAHTWSTALLPDGDYQLEVEAADLAGNTGSLTRPFTLAKRLIPASRPPFALRTRLPRSREARRVVLADHVIAAGSLRDRT
jgi:hypothetical protein